MCPLRGQSLESRLAAQRSVSRSPPLGTGRMLIESQVWRDVERGWRPHHTLHTLLALPREEARRIQGIPLPDLTSLIESLGRADMPVLCQLVASNLPPAATIATCVLQRLARESSPLVTDEVLASWLDAIATAQAPVLAQWRAERSPESLSAMHEEFLSRVPLSVSFRALCAHMAPATRSDGHWASYSCGDSEFQIWADESGRYNASHRS